MMIHLLNGKLTAQAMKVLDILESSENQILYVLVFLIILICT
jgi:hypothetical protein